MVEVFLRRSEFKGWTCVTFCLSLEEFLELLHFEDDEALDDCFFAEGSFVRWMVSVDGVTEDQLVSRGCRDISDSDETH